MAPFLSRQGTTKRGFSTDNNFKKRQAVSVEAKEDSI